MSMHVCIYICTWRNQTVEHKTARKIHLRKSFNDGRWGAYRPTFLITLTYTACILLLFINKHSHVFHSHQNIDHSIKHCVYSMSPHDWLIYIRICNILILLYSCRCRATCIRVYCSILTTTYTHAYVFIFILTYFQLYTKYSMRIYFVVSVCHIWPAVWLNHNRLEMDVIAGYRSRYFPREKSTPLHEKFSSDGTKWQKREKRLRSRVVLGWAAWMSIALNKTTVPALHLTA